MANRINIKRILLALALGAFCAMAQLIEPTILQPLLPFDFESTEHTNGHLCSSPPRGEHFFISTLIPPFGTTGLLHCYSPAAIGRQGFSTISILGAAYR